MSSVVAVSVDWAFLSASRWSIGTLVSQRAVGLLGPHLAYTGLHPSSNLKSSSIRTGILSRIVGRPRRELPNRRGRSSEEAHQQQSRTHRPPRLRHPTVQKLSGRTDFKIRISETRPLSRVNARISTADQNPRMQLDALVAAGCLKVYKDTATGTKAARPQWIRCLDDLRTGDTLVIWKIDRLGRNLRDLIDIVTTLESRGVGVQSLTNGIVDTTTAHGKLVFACSHSWPNTRPG